MARCSNRLAATQAPTRRSFQSDQEDKANALKSEIEELGIEGEGGYKVRSEDELSKVEKFLNSPKNNHTIKNLFTLDFMALFQRPKTQLETWSLYFSSKEELGIEMHQGLVTLWSNFLIAETLLAAISIQPLITVPNTIYGWQLKLYGYIWMMSMISEFWGIAVTALFLGYLLGCPNKVAWKWMCKLSWLSKIPSILVLLDTILTFVATAYTCWILYGYTMGIICVVLEVFFVITNLKLAAILGEARKKAIKKITQ